VDYPVPAPDSYCLVNDLLITTTMPSLKTVSSTIRTGTTTAVSQTPVLATHCDNIMKNAKGALKQSVLD